MKNSIISILFMLVTGITVIYAQERPVEGIFKEKDQTISRVKLFENEQNEIVLFITDSSRSVNLDSIFQTYHYSDFTMGDSINKLNDTIQQVVTLENGQLNMQDVQMELNIKQHEKGFSLKIDADKNANNTGEFGTGNARTLEISDRYWCMESNSYSKTMRECQNTCKGECFKRSF